jgi:hypothetical protein
LRAHSSSVPAVSTQSSPLTACHTSAARRGTVIGLASQSSFASASQRAWADLRSVSMAFCRFSSLETLPLRSAVSAGMASVVSAMTRKSACARRW